MTSSFLGPLVSVIIPAYNASATIERALESVLAQTYSRFEIIVIDDGSRDNTRAVLARYSNRLIYVYQENQERSAARNRGITLARGEYVAFLDADDWWLPEKLERQVTVLNANSQVGLVYVRRIMVAPNGNHSRKVSEEARGSEDYSILPFSKLLLRNWVGSPSQVMVRAQVLADVGGFDTALRQGEDWDLWLRIASKYPMASIAAPLTCFQLSEQGNLQRMIKRDVYSAYHHIMDKLFSLQEVRVRYGHLENPARARVLLQLAFVDCALVKYQAGRGKLALAAKLSPDLFNPNNMELDIWTIEFANTSTSYLTPLPTALMYINTFWNMLPNGLSKSLRRKHNRVKATLCAGRFFDAYGRQDWHAVRASAWRAARFQPGWLKNRGFLSIWTQSFVRPLDGFLRSHTPVPQATAVD